MHGSEFGKLKKQVESGKLADLKIDFTRFVKKDEPGFDVLFPRSGEPRAMQKLCKDTMELKYLREDIMENENPNQWIIVAHVRRKNKAKGNSVCPKPEFSQPIAFAIVSRPDDPARFDKEEDKNTLYVDLVCAGISGQGLGKRLLEKIVEFGKANGFDRVVLDSVNTAVKIYKKNGYELTGEMIANNDYDEGGAVAKEFTPLAEMMLNLKL